MSSPLFLHQSSFSSLQLQGNKGRVELKVRTHVHESDDGQITGIEVWKKYKVGKGQVSLCR